jgi:hypothetical protein
MTINLTNPNDLTFANVRNLLASGPDDIDLELRVTDSGIVFLSDVTGPERMGGICFRIGEANMKAHDGEFIGQNAAAVNDDGLVDQVLRTIAKNWQLKPQSRFAEMEPY